MGLIETLDDKNCRYFLYDYVTIDPKFNKKKEKTVFVFWSPPNCNQQMKMMYSAYLVNCRDDMKFAHHETFQDEDDFEMMNRKCLTEHVLIVNVEVLIFTTRFCVSMLVYQ